MGQTGFCKNLRLLGFLQKFLRFPAPPKRYNSQEGSASRHGLLDTVEEHMFLGAKLPGPFLARNLLH